MDDPSPHAVHADASAAIPPTLNFNGDLPQAFSQRMPGDLDLTSPTDYGPLDEAHPIAHHVTHHPSETPARVPLPPQHSQSTPMLASPPATGPMSSKVVIPPRPRPGRKPIAQEDAADRRRIQNRIAQRNFRDKRQQKLYETQLDLEENKKLYQERLSDHERNLQQYKEEVARLKAQVDEIQPKYHEATKRNLELEALVAAYKTERSSNSFPKFSPHTTAGYPPMPARATIPANSLPGLSINTNSRAAPQQYGAYGAANVPTPPEDTYNETDFTNLFRSSQHRTACGSLRSIHSNDSATATLDVSMSLEGGDRCGFCTDDQNCACRSDQQSAATVAVAAAPLPATLPGNCDACRRDPERAQACRDLASQTQLAPAALHPSTSATSAHLFNNGDMPAAPRMSCSTMLDKVTQQNNGRLASIAEIFGGGEGQGRQPVVLLHAVPAADGRGYEIEEREAAEVLQSLSWRRSVG